MAQRTQTNNGQITNGEINGRPMTDARINAGAQGVLPERDPRPLHYKDDKSSYAVTVGKPVAEVFTFWRNFENLKSFMKDVKDIQVLTPKTSRWIVEIEAGVSAQWDAEIIEERQNEMIAWRSLEGAEVETSGAVWFREAPAGLGTVVSLTLDYQVPGGKLTEWITKLKGEDPDSLTFTNLRRLKCFLETGEIATTKGQSSGREEDLISTIKH